MKVVDLVDVLDKSTFIAVGTKNRISYSGCAKNFSNNHFLSNYKIEKIIMPKSESSATIIYVEV